MTDQELVQACLKGNSDAQRLLYDKFAPHMMSVCLRYAGNPADAQDMMQEGFIKVFDKLGKFSGTGSLAGWVRMVVINSALIQLRQNKKHLYHDDVEEAHDLSNSDVDVISQLSAKEIVKLIQDMPNGYRTVFNLFAVEGYSHKEIADMMDISENTSKTQFFKAKAWLRKQLVALERTQ